MKKTLAAAALALAFACGKRGDPHPPVPVIPKATSDLVVAQRGAKLILSWSFPSLTTTGQKLGDIRRIVVYRYSEPLPVTEPAAPDVQTSTPTAIDLFAKVPPITRPQFTKLRQKADTLEKAELPTATSGAKLTYEDQPPFHTTDGRPLRVNYAVVTEGAGGKSEMSNITTIVPLDVPVPPEGLNAEAQPEGLVLTWTAPTKVIEGDVKPQIVGYNIYRMAKGSEITQTATPVNTTPVAQTTYTDTPPYGVQQYVVTAVSAAGKPPIESDPSAPASAEFKDLVPPPVPTGLTALVEPSAVRLLWDPVSAPDLAGYKVYRWEGVGVENPVRIEKRIPVSFLITETHLVDPGLTRGIAYYFEVTSVDKSGNESKPARTEWVVVPKTP